MFPSREPSSQERETREPIGSGSATDRRENLGFPSYGVSGANDGSHPSLPTYLLGTHRGVKDSKGAPMNSEGAATVVGAATSLGGTGGRPGATPTGPVGRCPHLPAKIPRWQVPRLVLGGPAMLGRDWRPTTPLLGGEPSGRHPSGERRAPNPSLPILLRSDALPSVPAGAGRELRRMPCVARQQHPIYGKGAKQGTRRTGGEQCPC